MAKGGVLIQRAMTEMQVFAKSNDKLAAKKRKNFYITFVLL
jgi:hypothetical protein